MRKVTAEEIERLYKFTRKHYVEYHDVQAELVDHLASGMESNWEKEPELSFEENLQQEFKSFGVFGFSEVVETKSRALEKRYFRLVWKEMKQQLGNPKILAAFLLTFSGILLLLKYVEPVLLVSVLFLSYGVLLYLMFTSSHELKRKKKKGEKIYLLEVFILNTGGYFSLSYLPFQIFYFSDFTWSDLWVQLAASLVFTLLAFLFYICIYVFPRKKDEILREQYPELKL